MENKHLSVRSMAVLAIVLSLSFSTGCVYRVAYNSDYLPTYMQTGGSRIMGKALLCNDPNDDVYVFKGRPSSFTGGGSKLEIPLGQINKEIGMLTFDRAFSSGCSAGNERDNAASYIAVIQSRVVSFDYKYNRMRNLDFATTPQINLTIQVNVSDPTGTLYFAKTYGSGNYSGDTVFDTLKPAELINKVTHEAFAAFYAQAAFDVEAAISKRHPPPPLSPAKPLPGARVSSATNQPATLPTPKTHSDRLKELKQLFDQGLISEEVYSNKQREILNSL